MYCERRMNIRWYFSDIVSYMSTYRLLIFFSCWSWPASPPYPPILRNSTLQLVSLWLSDKFRWPIYFWKVSGMQDVYLVTVLFNMMRISVNWPISIELMLLICSMWAACSGINVDLLVVRCRPFRVVWRFPASLVRMLSGRSIFMRSAGNMVAVGFGRSCWASRYDSNNVFFCATVNVSKFGLRLDDRPYSFYSKGESMHKSGRNFEFLVYDGSKLCLPLAAQTQRQHSQKRQHPDCWIALRRTSLI